MTISNFRPHLITLNFRHYLREDGLPTKFISFLIGLFFCSKPFFLTFHNKYFSMTNDFLQFFYSLLSFTSPSTGLYTPIFQSPDVSSSSLPKSNSHWIKDRKRKLLNSCLICHRVCTSSLIYRLHLYHNLNFVGSQTNPLVITYSDSWFCLHDQNY